MDLIKTMNKKDMEKVISFMEENNIKFKLQSGYESFILEESKNMLEVAICNNDIDTELAEAEFDTIVDDIADILFQNYSEHINDTYSYDITEDVLRNFSIKQ